MDRVLWEAGGVEGDRATGGHDPILAPRVGMSRRGGERAFPGDAGRPGHRPKHAFIGAPADRQEGGEGSFSRAVQLTLVCFRWLHVRILSGAPKLPNLRLPAILYARAR